MKPTRPTASGTRIAIVAQALLDGRDLNEIGLMRAVAKRTVSVLASETRRAVA